MRFRWAAAFILLATRWSAPAWADGDLMVRMTPQVLETDRSVAWEQPLARLTRSGQPVVINIEAEGLEIRISVTPFVRGEEFLVVVQGEVRQKRAGSVRGATSLQSVMVPPGESIAYFPLGRNQDKDARQMVVFIKVETNVE